MACQRKKTTGWVAALAMVLWLGGCQGTGMSGEWEGGGTPRGTLKSPPDRTQTGADRPDLDEESFYGI